MAFMSIMCAPFKFNYTTICLLYKHNQTYNHKLIKHSVIKAIRQQFCSLFFLKLDIVSFLTSCTNKHMEGKFLFHQNNEIEILYVYI